MTWHYNSVKGAMPSWTCDSCTTRRDKCCAFTMGLLSTFDIYSKSQFLPRMRGGPKELADALTPIMATVEKHCPYSSLNAPKKPETAANSFTFDIGKGERVYLNGKREPMSSDDYQLTRNT